MSRSRPYTGSKPVSPSCSARQRPGPLSLQASFPKAASVAGHSIGISKRYEDVSEPFACPRERNNSSAPFLPIFVYSAWMLFSERSSPGKTREAREALYCAARKSSPRSGCRRPRLARARTRSASLSPKCAASLARKSAPKSAASSAQPRVRLSFAFILELTGTKAPSTMWPMTLPLRGWKPLAVRTALFLSRTQ